MAKDDSIEAVQKVLGNPVSADLPENALKVRRNLLLISLVVIFVYGGDIRIDALGPIFGFKFIGLTDEKIAVGLAIINGYLLTHFCWYAFDSFFEWRLRITGTRVAFVTTGRFSTAHADYPSDPRQSTLHNWWIEQTKNMPNLLEKIHDVNENIEKLRNELTNITASDKSADIFNNIQKVKIETNRALDKCTKLNNAADGTFKELFEAKRIPTSLARFDNWTEIFLRSQNLRWLVIEVGMPIIVGLLAISFLISRLSGY